MTEQNAVLVERIRRTWSLLTVPVRPSVEGLRVYSDYLREGDHVLVLGATPELIDLAVARGAARVVSMERFQPVILALRSFAQESWDRVELRCADWLEKDASLEGGFDCVMCDGGLLFLGFPAAWTQLLKILHSYLVPGGVFVGKMTALMEVAGGRTFEQSVDALLKEYDRAREERPEDSRAAFVDVLSQLRVMTFLGATKPDGSFDIDLLGERTDRLLAMTLARYHDPDEVDVIRAALVYLARSHPDRVDTVTGATAAQAQAVFERNGFSFQVRPLPDPPFAGGGYMICARSVP